MNEKISLGMIVKGTEAEPGNLKRCLQSVSPFVDAIYITLTGPKDKLKEVEEVCQQFKANVSYYHDLYTITQKETDWLKNFFGYDPSMRVGDKLFLFDDARNFNLQQIPKEYNWMLWLDCDDVFFGGEYLHKLADLGAKDGYGAFYMNYVYQAEVDENFRIKHVIIEHLRERLIRNNGQYKWIAPIHETFIEQVPTNKTMTNDCYVLHLATDADRKFSLTRNLNNLEFAVYKTEGKDPRHLYYLAKVYFDVAVHLGKKEYFDKAVPLIEKYLWGEHKSGWPEERAQAAEYLADIYRNKGALNNSMKAGMNALIEAPESASIFLSIASTCLYKKEWERALFWTKLSTNVVDKKSTLVRNPKDIQVRTLEIIYQACLQLAEIDEAWAAAKKLINLMPGDPYFTNNFNFIDDLRRKRDLTKTVVTLADYLKASGQRDKLRPLIMAAPKEIEQNPFIQELYQKNFPPKYWSKDEITIYCGPGFTNWSPKRLSDPGEAFIGGSEEAVIRMSVELQKLGWKVTVYADPGADEGEHDGVQWLPYYKYNKLDQFNVLIVWRQIGFLDNELKAKKIYAWNHDIQLPHDWTEARYTKLTKAFWLSKWHRDNVPNLPEDKVMITSNGI